MFEIVGVVAIVKYIVGHIKCTVVPSPNANPLIRLFHGVRLIMFNFYPSRESSHSPGMTL